ncbi:DUF3943 domain-containing protein [Treponema zioleckii]|uniref:DUF3943 domain-containing protein n=1 Tax=Treponema zioleckii TaxID=331680 RepID=UPI00168A7E84|nr:DUF3943 domain-containing protein [Treponema zioleckii]
MRKIISFIALSLFLFSIYGQEIKSEETEFESKEEKLSPAEGASESTENEYFFEKAKANVRNVAITTGVVFLQNVFVNQMDRFVLGKEYAIVGPASFYANLTGDWWWDIDDFPTNQFGHPYQGSMYFTAGRANGLDFWHSFLVAGIGSLLWEEFGEIDAPSKNDILTTPFCGSIFGEVFHRLYLDAMQVCSPIAWIISPIDALSRIFYDELPTVSGQTQEIDFIFHGGAEFFNMNYDDSTPSADSKNFLGGTSVHIQYGKPYAHKTVEPYDLFTVDFNANLMSELDYEISFLVDGYLHSNPTYFELSKGTYGINLLYEASYSEDKCFSNLGVGFKYQQETPFSESDKRLTFYTTFDGILLGTRSLYPLFYKYSQNRSWVSPSRKYNFGYGLLSKFGLSFEHPKLGDFYLDTSASTLFVLEESQITSAEWTKNFMLNAKLRYEKRLAKNFKLGVQDELLWEKDFYNHDSNPVQFTNRMSLYTKFDFSRN